MVMGGNFWMVIDITSRIETLLLADQNSGKHEEFLEGRFKIQAIKKA
jgi:hypothetical protein